MSKLLIQNLLKEELEKRSNNTDKLLESYFNGLINDSELIVSLNKELNTLTEGVVDKAYDWVIGKLAYLYSKAIKAGEMVIKAIKAVLKVISKFREKYPRAHRIFITLILMLVFLVVSTSTAHAANNGLEPPIALYDAAIGILETAKTDTDGVSKGIEALTELTDAQTYLLGLKQGDITSNEFNERTIELANWSMDYVRKLVQGAKEGGDEGFGKYEFLLKLKEMGSKLISSSVSIIKSVNIDGSGGSEVTTISQNWAK